MRSLAQRNRDLTAQANDNTLPVVALTYSAEWDRYYLMFPNGAVMALSECYTGPIKNGLEHDERLERERTNG